MTDVLPNVPKDQGGLNLTRAYNDLRQVWQNWMTIIVDTSHPHPYNSHSNDVICDDLISNGSLSSSATAVYFEGTDILVKINGTSASASGVLFSVHYDSVSTALGSTDDAMGGVTLLQLIQHFAENRSIRTAVFNINNGEEDWSNGAHAQVFTFKFVLELFFDWWIAQVPGTPIVQLDQYLKSSILKVQRREG